MYEPCAWLCGPWYQGQVTAGQSELGVGRPLRTSCLEVPQEPHHRHHHHHHDLLLMKLDHLNNNSHSNNAYNKDQSTLAKGRIAMSS